jgi:precorrin-3B synthase
LTPWRTILVPVASTTAARALSTRVRGNGFITDPTDPRCRVAACPGAPACAQATTPVRADAARLAAEISGATGSGISLHVSGCEKGCAHPRQAPITLVARDGRYDLIRDGKPSDTPAFRDLSLEQAAEQVKLIAANQRQGAAA